MKWQQWLRASFIAALGATLHLGASVNAGAQEKPAREPRGLAQWPSAVTSAEVTPNPALVAVGETFWLTLTLKDAQGNSLSASSVNWSSSDPSVVTVVPTLMGVSYVTGGSGLVRSLAATLTGIGTGSAIVTASAEGISASTQVTVVPTTEEYRTTEDEETKKMKLEKLRDLNTFN